jgi:hypothetical protein
MPVPFLVDNEGRPLASYKTPLPSPEDGSEAPAKELWQVAEEAARLQSTNKEQTE